MKTQISTLINGSSNVIRDLSHEKYATAPKGTSAEFGGTNSKVRAAIAEQMHAENMEGIRAIVRGVELVLARESSVSGKTISYFTELTEAQYKTIMGIDEVIWTSETSFHLTISHNAVVYTSVCVRRTQLSTWKPRGCTNIGEEFVTIL